MKILAISVRIPEDGKKGDQALSFHRLSYLATLHTIQLVCFGSPEKDAASIAKLESLGISVEIIKWNKLVAFFNVVRSLIYGKVPFQCALFQSSPFRRAVIRSINLFNPEAVYAVMIRPLVNILPLSLPLFVDMVDSMGLNFSRRITMERGLKRIAFKIEWQRVSAYEVEIARIATRCFVVSSVDQKYIGGEKVESLPLGINSDLFYKQFNGFSESVIVFTGNMNYKPNEDAVIWFYRNCWSNLKLEEPGVRWVIAGNNPTSAVQALRSDPTITVTGRVTSLGVVINSACVSIAPMQSGSGMQFKILEAMACGVPVVTTSLGLGDIGAKPGLDLLLADSAKDFVEAILTTLRSPDLRERIGDAGLRYVKAHHSWDALNAEFERTTIGSLR